MLGLVILSLWLRWVECIQKNILMIIVDDLRPELGCYYIPGSQFHDNMHTPNIDMLASRSVLFQEAYVQYPLCGPSRSSLFTGRRPDTVRVYSNAIYWRETGGDFKSFPQYLKENGYTVLATGKMLPKSSNVMQDPVSWTRPVHVPNNLSKIQGTKSKTWTLTNESAYLLDMGVADKAKEYLDEIALEKSKPFFLGVGFYKPHLPWVFPDHYLHYYPRDIALPINPYPPENMPDIAWTGHAAIFNKKYKDILALNVTGDRKSSSDLPDKVVQELRRAYCSSVSYIDDLVGDVVNHLKDTGLANDTIIVFMSDHGWHLGEHGRWGKATNFHLNTRSPLIIHIPGVTDKGAVTYGKVEFVDIFPTLLEAAGIKPIPKCRHMSHKITLCHEGHSFFPLLHQPNKSWKENIFWQVKSKNNTMGYSIYDGKYRFTMWTTYTENRVKIMKKDIIAEELYDHRTDSLETVNVASQDQYRREVWKLRTKLKDAFNKGVYSEPK